MIFLLEEFQPRADGRRILQTYHILVVVILPADGVGVADVPDVLCIVLVGLQVVEHLDFVLESGSAVELGHPLTVFILLFFLLFLFFLFLLLLIGLGLHLARLVFSEFLGKLVLELVEHANGAGTLLLEGVAEQQVIRDILH